MVRIMDSKRSVLTDSLSVPKIIGKGPIITAPPPLIFPLLRIFVKNRRTTAGKVIRNPAKISYHAYVDQ